MKIIYASVLACCFLVSVVSRTAWAQVDPEVHWPSTTGSVNPSKVLPVPGYVAPLPVGQPTMDQVMAEGRAPIFDGDVETARKSALRMAYAEAVSRVVGVEIGTLTVIHNVHRVSDVVMSRSIGFVRRYEIIREGLASFNPRYYEVVIRAEVVSGGVFDPDEIDGLRLYLELLNNPKLLILLPERSVAMLDSEVKAAISAKGLEVRSGDAHIRITEAYSSFADGSSMHAEIHDNEIALRGAEAAMAQAFSRYGYRVMTSDELLASHIIGPEIVAAARRGATHEALTAARAVGAELALVGGIRFSESMVKPAGVSLIRVSAEVSAKAVVTSSGRNLAIFHQTYLSASSDRLMAYTQAAGKAADGIATVLAWRIPQVLAEESRETRVILHGVEYAAAENVRQALLQKAGVDDVRLARLPTAENQTVELVLLSSFIGVEPGHVIEICRIELNRDLEVIMGDRFHIELKSDQ